MQLGIKHDRCYLSYALTIATEVAVVTLRAMLDKPSRTYSEDSDVNMVHGQMMIF